MASEHDGHGNSGMTDAMRRALDAWVTCAQETLARQRAFTPGAARRIEEERVWQEQQRAACELTTPADMETPEHCGHRNSDRQAWPGGEAIEAYMATTRAQGAHPFTMGAGLTLAQVQEAVAAVNRQIGTEIVRATVERLATIAPYTGFPSTLQSPQTDGDGIPDDTALPLDAWNAKVDALLADVAQHHASETHPDTLPTADVIHAMDGPHLTALALTLGLAPAGMTAETVLDVAATPREVRVRLNWAPHARYAEAADVWRRVRAYGIDTVTRWTPARAARQGDAVAYRNADGLRVAVSFGADDEPLALLRCACLAVTTLRRRECGRR